jgi:phospholipid transport system transporter-binding protein
MGMSEQSVAQAELQVRDGTLFVSGEICFDTVNRLLDQGRGAIRALSSDEAVLDLSAVTKSDSAGLALVVDWVRTAQQRGAQLQVVGMSPQLLDIARVSGLDAFLCGVQ